jgi:hypothetical protein
VREFLKKFRESAALHLLVGDGGSDGAPTGRMRRGDAAVPIRVLLGVKAAARVLTDAMEPALTSSPSHAAARRV